MTPPVAVRVGRRYEFRAQHHLPGAPEPWCLPHWHDYAVEVEWQGRCDDLGMIVDTDVADQLAREILNPLDGSDLNKTAVTPTSVEVLARWLIARFDVLNARVRRVRVTEDGERWGECCYS